MLNFYPSRTLQANIPRRASSPTFIEDADRTAESIELDPELARIAMNINAQPARLNSSAQSNADDLGSVAVNVRWKPHPQQGKQSEVWNLRLKRVS
jgi:hypothetical protein